MPIQIYTSSLRTGYISLLGTDSPYVIMLSNFLFAQILLSNYMLKKVFEICA